MASNDSHVSRADGGHTAENPAEAADDDPLRTLFGDHAKVDVLIGFLNANEPLNPSDIVENADIDSRTSWYRQKDDLLDSGLIEQVGKVGNSPKYDLARDSHVFEFMQKLRDAANSNRLEARRERRDDEE